MFLAVIGLAETHFITAKHGMTDPITNDELDTVAGSLEKMQHAVRIFVNLQYDWISDETKPPSIKSV